MYIFAVVVGSKAYFEERVSSTVDLEWEILPNASNRGNDLLINKYGYTYTRRKVQVQYPARCSCLPLCAHVNHCRKISLLPITRLTALWACVSDLEACAFQEELDVFHHNECPY